MSGVGLCRTTRLVSIDAHPANNSLVITYEILVVAEDESSGLELGRRNKRDQFQISVSAFDDLSERPKPVNFSRLAGEILSKCPILADANQTDTLDDIQLNLLYLFNRKQAQLSQPARPPSSASVRNNRSATSVPAARGARFVNSAARAKDPAGQKCTNLVENPIEIYQLYREKELKLAKCQDDAESDRVGQFVSYLDEHLLGCEDDLGLGDLSHQVDSANIEAQLEDLYGELDERRRSVARLRHLVRDDDARLMSIASNRLLIYALLRLLRDVSGRDLPISESILFCLIRFTSFEDVFNVMPFSEAAANSENESLDLARVIIDLTNEHVKSLTANADQNVKLITDKSYYTNSLLTVLANLIRLDHADPGHRLRRKLTQSQNGIKLADILTEFLVLFAKHLPRDIRSSNKTHQKRITWTLMELFNIGVQLSILKPFVNLIRTAPRVQKIVDSLLAILNCLQLSRPGSGSSQFQQVLANDEVTLLLVYELEIELMLMINNLVHNSKFRTRFARKQLALKCILRSLVVFLASSRQSSALSSFNESLALVTPLRLLYQFGRCESVKQELFESRVIMRCLLEYLLIAASALKAEIETNWQDIEWTRNGEDVNQSKRGRVSGADLKLTHSDQITLSSFNAHRFIVCFWINLTAKPEASIYKQDTDKRDEEINRLIESYIKSSNNNLDSFTRLILAANQKQIRKHLVRSMKNSHLMLYLHMKLMRSLSEHLDGARLKFSQNQFVASLLRLFEFGREHKLDTFAPLLVESLAVLTNQLMASSRSKPDEQTELSAELSSLISQLYDCPLIDCTSSSNSDVDNDDLLLISINLLSQLAGRHEICPQLESNSASIIKIINLVLEHRAPDTQLQISAAFCLNQLLKHAAFLLHFGSQLDVPTNGENQDSYRRDGANQLLERLCSLMQHPDVSLVKLVDQILSKLKQFEESRSLADSVTYKKCFTSYNGKWLKAIRANREDPPDEPISIDELKDQFKLDGLTSNAVADALDGEQSKFDDYRHLRTITASSSARTNSRLTSTSSVSQCNSRAIGSKRTGTRDKPQETGADDNEEEDDDDDDDYDDDDDDDDDYDDDTFGVPDVNVIDSMSTIGHLRERQLQLNSIPTGSEIMKQT